MFALDAMIHLNTLDSTRVVSIHDFMTGVKRSVRQQDEIITSIDFPIINGWQGYSKVGVRNAMVISVASACLVAMCELRSGLLVQPLSDAVKPKHGLNHHKTSLPASPFRSMSQMNLDDVLQANRRRLTIIAAQLNIVAMQFLFLHPVC